MGSIGMPRGEVLIGGPTVTAGYFIDPENPDPELAKKNVEEYMTFVDAKTLRESPDKIPAAMLKNPAYVTQDLDDPSKLVPTRWFRTGDIGQINKSGVVQIIDRKKDLWKGPQGEYVSFGKVENILKVVPEIEQCCVYGKTGGKFCVALVVPA